MSKKYIQLTLILLLLPHPVSAVEQSSAWTVTQPCLTLRVNDINYDQWFRAPLVIPDNAEITSVHYNASFSWTSPYVQMLVGTGDTTGELPKGVLFGTSETLFDGDSPEKFAFRHRVEQDEENVVLPEDDILLHPMYGGQCTVTVNYGWDDGEPEPAPPLTPAERFIRIQPAINLLLLGDE